MHLFGRLAKRPRIRNIDSVAQPANMMAPESSTYEFYPIEARFPAIGSDPDDGVNRKVFVRHNIDEWSSKKSNKKQVDLFILALAKFQKSDPKEKLSYFQVAGMCFSAWIGY